MDLNPRSGANSPPPPKKESASTPSSTPTRTPGPQLISHLPRAEEAAMKTFLQVSDNIYQYKTLGRSRQTEECLQCDCSYEHGMDPLHMACGDGSDCINRLTQVECEEDECRCKSHCQNQRFQRKEFAQFEIVHTEMKGYGLRAVTDISKDTFIYEYIGEVISHPSFVKRMREYAEERIQHFYFMMLQKDEFIDATKKGGVGRFANHSCNPNCYVAKWTVGKKVRMGIFAKRTIQKDEELTFNYNVDRYGHDAQPCYCGEERCLGFIGGKTQTDIATMDDSVLDALGITEDVEALGLKGNKKKKGKKIDEDFVPVLHPVALRDAPKVVLILRETSNRSIMYKLLTRIKMTEDPTVLRQIMRLRGFGLMASLLQDSMQDTELCTLVLECLPAWPLINRNKIENSKIEEPVKLFADSQNERLQSLADQLLTQWAALETAYRIPKKAPRMDENTVDGQPVSSPPPELLDDHRPAKRPRFGERDLDGPILLIKPLGQTHRFPPSSKPAISSPAVAPTPEIRSVKPTKEILAAIIAAATTNPIEPTSSALNGHTDNDKKLNKDSTKKPKANKEQRLVKLVGAVVVESMSKYKSKMDVSTFKQHAKDVTHLIVEREKKSSSYATAKMDKLSGEKREKIKKYVKDSVKKMLHKRKDKRSLLDGQRQADKRASPEETSNKGAGDSPNSNDGPECIAAPRAEVDSLIMDIDELVGENALEETIDRGSGAEEDPWEAKRLEAATTNDTH